MDMFIALYITPLVLVILCTKAFQILADLQPQDAKMFAGLAVVPFLNFLILAFEVIAIVTIVLEWAFNTFYGDE